MSEIKKRRVETKYDGHTYAAYAIDSSLFAKDSGVIKLPNPGGKDRYRASLWKDVILTDNAQPWLSTSLYKTIRELGFFPFAYSEEISEQRGRLTNVVITKDGHVELFRREGEGEYCIPIIPKFSCNVFAVIHFYDDLYQVRGENFGGDPLLIYSYKKNSINGIDPQNTNLYGFEIVEKYLLEHEDD